MLVHARRKETEALANSVTRHVFDFCSNAQFPLQILVPIIGVRDEEEFQKVTLVKQHLVIF
jgi:hypothetical protein